MTPTLSTPALILKPLLRASKRNVDWLNDPEVVQYSENRHHKHTQLSCNRYIASFIGDSHIWAITTIQNGHHIGNITSTHDENNKISEIAILIGDKDEWGKGYGREAWTAVVQWVLGSGKVRKIEAGCSANNLIMKNILDRDEQMRLEGNIRLHFLFQGHPVNMLRYGRFA